MSIHDLMYQANAGKRRKARKALARRWAVGLCFVTTATSLGVVTGVLVAPKAGKETIVDLRKFAAKSVSKVEKAILGKGNEK